MGTPKLELLSILHLISSHPQTKHKAIGVKQAWSIKNYRYVWDVSHPFCFSYLPCSFDFQPGYDGGSPNFDRSSLPTNISDAEFPSAPHSLCRCVEHLSRISDLEGRLSLLKSQAKAVVDQAGRSFGLMKRVSSLESQVSDLMAKILHLEECDSFLIGIIESACEQLQCEFLEAPLYFLMCSCDLCYNFLLSRCLLKPHRRESPGSQTDCGSWEGIVGYQYLLDWSVTS
jgi:hypothetical protein